MRMGRAQPKTISPVRLKANPVNAGATNFSSALTARLTMVVAKTVAPVCRWENNVHITGR